LTLPNYLKVYLIVDLINSPLSKRFWLAVDVDIAQIILIIFLCDLREKILKVDESKFEYTRLEFIFIYLIVFPYCSILEGLLEEIVNEIDRIRSMISFFIW
jgi:hypothetical protein